MTTDGEATSANDSMQRTETCSGDNWPPNEQRRTPGSSWKVAALLPSAVVVLWAIGISLVYWPGNMDADALNQIAAAKSGHFTDWWAPILDWLWRGLFLVHLSPGFVLLGTIITILLAIYGLFRVRLGRWASCIATILLSIYPPVFGFLGSLQRDTWFTAFGLSAYAFYFRSRRAQFPTTYWWLTAVAVSAWFGMAARQNGFVFLLPVLAMTIYSVAKDYPRLRRGAHIRRNPSTPTRRVLVGAVVGSLVLVLAFAVSQSILTYRIIGAAHTYPSQAVFEGDLATLSVRTNTVLLPSFVYPAQSLAVLKKHYSPYGSTFLLEGPDHPLVSTTKTAVFPSLVDASEETKLRQDWEHAIANHPGAYLKLRWKQWTALIAWSGPSYEPYHPGIDQNPWGYRPNFRTLERLAIDYERHFNPPPLEGGPLFRTWIYLLMVILVGVDLARRSREAELRLVGIMALAAAAFYVEYLFVNPGLGFRFGWLMVIVSLISLVLNSHDYLHRRAWLHADNSPVGVQG
jgi:hypothetical protein